ncbi:unnamed protein product [Protopolystoma xenopodis]|uniref:Secreted protein n=1 Tax=Protopolystoma xenopodis TaxID=117903 RepID=A0A3S5CJB6_9PLAT|nr:unnamed protein product [Protopolystoma xenopodis]
MRVFAFLHYLLISQAHVLLVPRPAVYTAQLRRYQASCGLNVSVSGGGASLNRRQQSSGTGNILCSLARQIVFGLTNLLAGHSAPGLPSSSDWQLVFGLLEVAGAGARPYRWPPSGWPAGQEVNGHQSARRSRTRRGLRRQTIRRDENRAAETLRGDLTTPLTGTILCNSNILLTLD